MPGTGNLRIGALAFVLLLAATGRGLCLSEDCNTEIKMVACCELYEKSLHAQIPQYGMDLAAQCSNELIGARDQVEQQKSFDACIPASVTNERLSQLFRAYVKNHPEFWDRPARFGMLNVWSLSWPCHK
ncbi:MAG: Rap1a/Tai family immunity protein [Rhodospirillaceae bacterium]